MPTVKMTQKIIKIVKVGIQGPQGPPSPTVDMIASKPPTGTCKVINLYINPTTGKMVVEYDDTPQE